MHKILKYCLILIFSTTLAWSQEETKQRKLEAEKARLQEEIREQEQLLRTEKKKERSVATIVGQQTTKINLQQRLINNTAKQA